MEFSRRNLLVGTLGTVPGLGRIQSAADLTASDLIGLNAAMFDALAFAAIERPLAQLIAGMDVTTVARQAISGHISARTEASGQAGLGTATVNCLGLARSAQAAVKSTDAGYRREALYDIAPEVDLDPVRFYANTWITSTDAAVQILTKAKPYPAQIAPAQRIGKELATCRSLLGRYLDVRSASRTLILVAESQVVRALNAANRVPPDAEGLRHLNTAKQAVEQVRIPTDSKYASTRQAVLDLLECLREGFTDPDERLASLAPGQSLDADVWRVLVEISESPLNLHRWMFARSVALARKVLGPSVERRAALHRLQLQTALPRLKLVGQDAAVAGGTRLARLV